MRIVRRDTLSSWEGKDVKVDDDKCQDELPAVIFHCIMGKEMDPL
jgi:hypothetical protein